MPRNGAGVYTLPAGYAAVTGQTGTADQHNLPLEDLQTQENEARPLTAGGTGAATASAARTNLGLVIGTDVMAYTADFAALASITDVQRAAVLASDLPRIDDTEVVDNSIDPGTYAYSTSGGSTNGPTDVTFGLLTHYRRASGGGEAQVMYPDSPSSERGRIYVRSRTTGSWSDWSAQATATELQEGRGTDRLTEQTVSSTPSEVDFTGVPSWATEIRVTCDGVSFSTQDGIKLRLGTSGGLQTTSYSYVASVVDGPAVGTSATSHTDGFGTYGVGSDGVTVFELTKPFTSNVWVCRMTGMQSLAATDHNVGTGRVTLSGALTQLRLVASANPGTYSFSTGTIAVEYR